MQTDELTRFAREKATAVLKVLADAVGRERAAEILVRVALEDLLGHDPLTAAEVFRAWAEERENATPLH